MTRTRGLAFLVPVTIGVGVLAAQQSDTTRNPLAGEPAAIAAGQLLYDQTCQSCHAPAGQGDRGPALNTGSFTHGQQDGDLFHTIREGVPGSQMPPFRGLRDDQVWQLVSYVRSLAGSGSVDPTSVRGNPAAGEAMFFGTAGCASCHQVNGRGGIVGPDLSTAGRTTASALRQKILVPSAPVAGTVAGGPGRGGAAVRGRK